MNTDFPQPVRRELPSSIRSDGPAASSPRPTERRARRWLSRLRELLVPTSSLVLATGLGCGGPGGDPVEPPGCSADAECPSGQQCVDTVCVEPKPMIDTAASLLACSVVDCPTSQPFCCTAATATANDNESQGYANRNQMVTRAQFSRGEVRAIFSFDAADQQGWITFDLDPELHLQHVRFTGIQFGVADRFLSVTTHLDGESGCAFGFELEPRASAAGEGADVFGQDIFFKDHDFCYGRARPGHASQLAFAIFSKEPGEGGLIITKIALLE